MIKILHILTQLELGGAQKNALEILSGLDADKYDIHLISSDGLRSQEARRIPGLHLTLLSFLRRSPHPLFDLLAFLFIFFYVKKNKIQIVHTHSSKAGILGRWAARCAGVPVIIHTIHGWGFHDYLKSFWNDFYILLEKKTAKITTKLIAVTGDDIRRGLEHGIGTREAYLLIRYGIDQNFFESGFSSLMTTKRHLGLEESDRVVAMVACLKPQKNPLDFIKAAEIVLSGCQDTKFLLVGDGILRPLLEKEIMQRDIADRFFMLGWRQDIDRILPVADILVLTSLWEGLPIVFLEAMSFAKPVVSYDVGGASEVISDGVNGFLVRPKDTQALAAKVKLLLENNDLRQRMGKMGRHIVSSNEFSLTSMIKQLDQLYDQSLRS